MGMRAVRVLSAGATVALLAACLRIRPDVGVGLVVLGAVFIVAERRWPVVPQRVWRPGWATDVVHFVVDQVLSGALVAVSAYLLVPPLDAMLPDLDRVVHGPARVAVAALVGELLGYWGHRAMHEVPALWSCTPCTTPRR